MNVFGALKVVVTCFNAELKGTGIITTDVHCLDQEANGFFPNTVQPSAWANSIEQSSSWEVNGSWTSQEITRILWNPKDYYCIHKGPSRVHILSQMNPVHAVALYLFLQISFNYTLTYA